MNAGTWRRSQDTDLNIRLSKVYLVVFAALTLLLVEVHEQLHAVGTRLLYGGWAEWVFDNVLPYRGCSPARLAVVDVVGPLFSYAMLWLGAVLAWRPGTRAQALGFSLAFASLPLGRLLPQLVTAFVEGSTSDEYGFLRRMAGDALDRREAGLLAFLVALALTLPPLVALWKRLPADRRLSLFVRFYSLPLVFVIVWLAGMNAALAHGVLSRDLLQGWPALVAVHAVLVTAVVWLGRQQIGRLAGSQSP